jgi:hypothetical protein
MIPALPHHSSPASFLIDRGEPESAPSVFSFCDARLLPYEQLTTLCA